MAEWGWCLIAIRARFSDLHEWISPSRDELRMRRHLVLRNYMKQKKKVKMKEIQNERSHDFSHRRRRQDIPIRSNNEHIFIDHEILAIATAYV